MLLRVLIPVLTLLLCVTGCTPTTTLGQQACLDGIPLSDGSWLCPSVGAAARRAEITGTLRHGSTYRVNYDAALWTEKTPAQGNPDRGLLHRTGDVYVHISATALSVPFLFKMDVGQAVLGSLVATLVPDARATLRETRALNGNDILLLTFAGTVGSMPTVGRACVYSGEKGLVELLALAPPELFAKHEADVMAVCAGLRIQ